MISLFTTKKKKPEAAQKPVPRKPRPKGKVVAYVMWGEDLKDLVYYDWHDRKDYCPVCHNTLIPMPPLNYVFRKRKGDIWISYDGFWIVSEKFRAFCEERGYPNLIFTPIAKSAGYYFFTTNEIYKFDYKRSEVLFIDKQDCCGNYNSIVQIPQYRSKDEVLHVDDFICRPAYYLGDFASKGPIIVVGLKTRQLMKQYGLSKFYFDNVYE